MDASSHLFHHIHMSVSMLALFIAFSPTQNLVTSTTPAAVGFWTLATIYMFLCISSILVGPLVVGYLKPKLSLLLGSLCYLSFVIATRWPDYSTMIPTGALVGIGGSILWTAQGTYLTQCGSNYAKKKGDDSKSAMGLFNGIFFALFQTNQIVGNLVASFILNQNSPDANHLLIYVFIGIASLSTISFLFIVPEDPSFEEDSMTTTPDISSSAVQPSINITEKLFSAIVLLKDTRLLFLLPIIFYSGVEQGFIFGSFTKNFVGKTIGTQDIGFVMTTFGAVDVIGSFLFGRIADSLGTVVVVIVGFIAHTSCLCVLFFVLNFEHYIVFFDSRVWLLYFIAGLWGLGDAAWNTFPGITVSVLFAKDPEPAFANLKFWQSLGSVLPFVTGALIPIEVSVTGVFGFLLFGIIGLCYLELFYKIFSHKERLITVVTEETTPLRKVDIQ